MPLTPFDRRTTKRVPTRSARVSLKGGPGGPSPCLDVSIEGIGIASPAPLQPGAQVEMEVDHKHVGVLSIAAQVAWCAEIAGTARIGLQFSRPAILQRTHLRRLMAAEVGSCVLDDDDRLRGFAVCAAVGVWAVFEPGATKVAVVHQDGDRFQVTHRPRGAAYDALQQHVTASFPDAVALALGAEGRLRFDPPTGPRSTPITPGRPAPSTGRHAAPTTGRHQAPTTGPASDRHLKPTSDTWPALGSAPPPPPPPPPPPSRAPAATAPAPSRAPVDEPAAAGPEPTTIQGSAVVVDGEPIGFVALTGTRTWSVYDPRQQQIAVLSSEQGTFTIFWLGGKPEDSLEYLRADSFPAALAAAFDLDHPPQLRSALISPQQRAEAAPPRKTQRFPAGIRVLFRHRAVGYLRPAAAGAWTVLDKAKEQLAMIAPANGLWRVATLGASPEDSLDFDDRDDFIEAVQLAFKLPELPTLDPPITPAAPTG